MPKIILLELLVSPPALLAALAWLRVSQAMVAARLYHLDGLKVCFRPRMVSSQFPGLVPIDEATASAAHLVLVEVGCHAGSGDV
jgi:hypothetical protein